MQFTEHGLELPIIELFRKRKLYSPNKTEYLP